MRMTIHKVRLLVGVLLGLILISPVSAQGDQSLRGKLEQAIEVASQNQLKIVSLNQTALPNIFEVELNTGEVLYSHISGDYLSRATCMRQARGSPICRRVRGSSALWTRLLPSPKTK